MRFVGDALHGDFGTSLRSNHPAFTDVWDAFPVTLQLSLAALSLAIAIGVPVGRARGGRPRAHFDNTVMTVTLFGVSMPIFWLGLMLILVFGATLDWLPIGGLMPSRHGAAAHHRHVASSTRCSPAARRSFWQPLRHLILPACTLAHHPARPHHPHHALRDAVDGAQDHVRTARAKGLPEPRVIVRHVLRNALIPVVTVIGLQLGLLLSGAVLTETIFSLPGLGRLMVNAILARDYPVVQAAALLTAFVFVLVNLRGRSVLRLLDPRIRYG